MQKYVIWLTWATGSRKVYTGCNRKDCELVLADIQAGLVPRWPAFAPYTIIPDNYIQ